MKSWLILILLFVNSAAIAESALSFNEALGQLIERNIELQSQEAELKRTQSQKVLATSQFLPTVSLAATDAQYSDLPVARNLTQFSHSQQGLILGEINLFRGFGDWANLKGSQAQVSGAKHNLLQARLNAEQMSIELLVNFIKASMVVQVSKNVFNLNQELMQIQTARYKRGLIPLQETQKAAIEKDNSLARLRDAEVELESTKAKLQTQLGSLKLVQELWPWQKLFTQAEVSQVLNKKPDAPKSPKILAAESTLMAEEYQRKAKFREYLPSLDLSVGYGVQDYKMADQMGWQTQLVLKIPIFDLTKHSNYKIQVQQEQLARLNLESEKRINRQQIQESQEQLKLALESAIQREISRKTALSLYQDNQRRLRAGRSSMNDILVDQNRLTQAELLAIQGWADSHLSYGRYCHSLGLYIDQNKFGCKP